MNDLNTSSREDLRRIFKRHRGAAANLAKELGIGPSAVSQFLRHKTFHVSPKTAERIVARARELAAQEEQEESAWKSAGASAKARSAKARR